MSPCSFSVSLVHTWNVFSIYPPSDTNLLDCSCNGMIALALGSSVYLWNSETRALMGYLETNPQPGRGSDHHTRSISCLCWSGEGTVLCIGTRQGEIQVQSFWAWRKWGWKLIVVLGLGGLVCVWGERLTPIWIRICQFVVSNFSAVGCWMQAHPETFAPAHVCGQSSFLETALSQQVSVDWVLLSKGHSFSLYLPCLCLTWIICHHLQNIAVIHQYS